MSTQRTVKLKNLRVANPSYSPKAAQQATTLAVVVFALLRLGII